ncbi:uncharacterized protein LACBIDRAFT_312485 [Laccaria bicolor S238N-H82]|uniref:Predicted protein n=1 Tax=Laccaria bicolor (strain S238N-H82 / ATCC MYA-4686) TaxID=486041 RepID=B0DWA2_LACBS|nr:uncharacterized protein LACBIDRAFT_312485 [Laccaria bicolor S238N-H82]EDR01153.1 predicted protein [Laccaria bicolor S238N-H82]|eukprot:XP_001888195.1 predicted protein [Laccaria bicolor S238N-H82]
MMPTPPSKSKGSFQVNLEGDDEGSSTNVRGPYSAQACNICRRKKTKCDNQRPVCGHCFKSGREAECSWAREPIVRKARTEALFESMQKNIEALREYANHLEKLLDKCCREHGGDIDTSYLRLRPTDAMWDMADHIPERIEETGAGSDSENESPVRELCIPTRNLNLEEGGFLLAHGNTAVFRFVQVPLPVEGPSRFPAIAENPDATYILLADGVDDSHYNPNFDWSRHLPSNVLLDRRSHDKALDLLFKFFTSWCLRIVPALFLRDMYRALAVPRSHTPPKTPHYSPMLHNALVALGTAFLDDPNIRDLKSRRCFADTAKCYLEVECQKPQLSVVHALDFLAAFHASQGDQTLGFLYFGMSARMGQALGLGVDCSDWVKLGLIDETERLDRNWAHWTTFSQDVCWSLYVGRDFCVTSPLNSSVPVPFVDTDLDEMPWSHPPAGIPPQANNISKTFAVTCELLMIARRIMDVVFRLQTWTCLLLTVFFISIKLNTWKSSLSPEVDISIASRSTATPHRLMLHLTYWWLFILLHRPFFHRRAKLIRSTDKEIDHVKLCKRAAKNIMELLATWRSLYTLRYTPITLAQAVFSAGTVYLLWGVQATSGTRLARNELETALDQQKLCHQYLVEIGKSWQCATNIAGILKNLMQEQLKPVLERRQLVPRVVEDEGIILPAIQRSSSASSRKRTTATSHRKGKQRGRGQALDTVLPPLDAPFNISDFHHPHNSFPAPQMKASTSSSSTSSFSSHPIQIPVLPSSTSAFLPPSPSQASTSASSFSAPPFGHLDAWRYRNPVGGSASSISPPSPSLFSMEMPQQGYIDHHLTPAPIAVAGPHRSVSMVNMGDGQGYIHEQRDPVSSFAAVPWFLANQADSPSSSPLSLNLRGALWPSVEPMNIGEDQEYRYEDDAMTDEDRANLNYWLQQLQE